LAFVAKFPQSPSSPISDPGTGTGTTPFGEAGEKCIYDQGYAHSLLGLGETASVFPFKTVGTLLKSPSVRWLERVFNFENGERLQKMISDHVGKL